MKANPPTPRRMVVEVIDDKMVELYRAMTPAQRIKIACDTHRTARLMLTTHIQHLNPNWTSEQVHAEVVRRLSHGST